VIVVVVSREFLGLKKFKDIAIYRYGIANTSNYSHGFLILTEAWPGQNKEYQKTQNFDFH